MNKYYRRKAIFIFYMKIDDGNYLPLLATSHLTFQNMMTIL
jgi:hypothetical protein